MIFKFQIETTHYMRASFLHGWMTYSSGSCLFIWGFFHNSDLGSCLCQTVLSPGSSWRHCSSAHGHHSHPEHRVGQALLFHSNIHSDLFSSASSVQLFSYVWLFAAPRTAACQASLPITNSWSLLRLMSIASVMPSNQLILCHPLLLPPSIFPSIRVFSNESVLRITWPKDWNFSFSISPSNEHPGLISFRMDWLDLLAVPGTLKSLLQYHSSKAAVLWHSAFFIVQLSHPYMTTGKTIALTRQTDLCWQSIVSAF